MTNHPKPAQSGKGPAESPKAPSVHNGTYTVASPRDGHFILKLHTAQSGALKGRRIISCRFGAKTREFAGVAFWDDEAKSVDVWRRHRGANSRFPINGFFVEDKGWSPIEQRLAIWCDLVLRGDVTGESGGGRGYWGSAGYTLHLEGRCVICNRKLTDPESIETGIGPVCAGRR